MSRDYASHNTNLPKLNEYGMKCTWAHQVALWSQGGNTRSLKPGLGNLWASRIIGAEFHRYIHLTFIIGSMVDVASIHNFSYCISGDSSYFLYWWFTCSRNVGVCFKLATGRCFRSSPSTLLSTFFTTEDTHSSTDFVVHYSRFGYFLIEFSLNCRCHFPKFLL